MEIQIQEGVHTLSVYFPPNVIETVLGTSHDGVTMIFDRKTFELEDRFYQVGQYAAPQLERLCEKAVNMLKEHYG